MSENKITIGLIAELLTPVGNHTTEAWEEKQEALYQADSKLELNYEVTLVFSRDFDKPEYEFSGMKFGKPKQADVTGFVSRCALIALPIKINTVQPYFSLWYNGSDSPMSLLTLAEFEAKE